jgi:hypothetical protein
MVRMLVWSVVHRGFEPRSGQSIEYKIGICCFSAKHAALRRKSKDWLVWNQVKVHLYLSGVTRLSVDCCFRELALHV